jgi:hypothetical protein
MKQRRISLDPRPDHLEAWKITYPPVESTRRCFEFEPMRFIPHDGKAKG